MTIGPATGKTALTLKQARDKFYEHSKLIREGKDPRQVEKEKEQAAQTAQETLADFWEEYHAWAQTKKKPDSLGKEEGHWNNWIEPALGNKPLQEITLSDWESLAQKLHKAGLSKRSQEYTLGTLRRILRRAYQKGKVSAPPPTGAEVGVTLKPGENRKTRVLSSDELQKILAELKELNLPAYRLALFSAYTGCRFSEAATLKWSQVDLSGKTVTFHETKNKDSRTVPLSKTVREELEAIGPGQPGEHVFIRKDGIPFPEPPESFRTVVNRLGLNKGRSRRDRITFHTLRHSAATLWAQSGLPLRDLMELGGWKTASMALRYQHGNDKAKQKAINSLESSLSSDSKVIPFSKSEETS